MSFELILTNRARQAIAEARSVDEVKDIRDKAEAVRMYAKQAGLGLEMINDAAEIKLRAERRAGEMLAVMEKHPPGRPSKNSLQRESDFPPTLDELGVSDIQSHRWQQMADIPEDKFEQYISESRAGKQELTTSGAMRLVQAEQRIEKVKSAQALPDKVFNVIYADPAWEYNNTGVHGAADHHYPTMPLDDICKLPQTIDLCIDDNAVLFMWVTNPFVRDAFAVIDAWGFEYKTNIAWVKTNLVKPGSGFYVRGRHELLYICTRGSFTPLDQNIAPPIGSVITAPVSEHSAKPDEAYSIIERLYPNCNYIELFARRRREGWSGWGNEIS